MARGGRPSPATRGLWTVERGEGDPLGKDRRGEGQNGVDPERAAPPVTATSTVITLLFMSAVASARFSQLRDPNEMRFEPLCAKFKILQLC